MSIPLLNSPAIIGHEPQTPVPRVSVISRLRMQSHRGRWPRSSTDSYPSMLTHGNVTAKIRALRCMTMWLMNA